MQGMRLECDRNGEAVVASDGAAVNGLGAMLKDVGFILKATWRH